MMIACWKTAMRSGLGVRAVGRDRNGWPVRSKAALLLALVAKRQGPGMVQQLLPQLLNAAGESGTHTEMVRPPCMIRSSPPHDPASMHGMHEGWSAGKSALQAPMPSS